MHQHPGRNVLQPFAHLITQGVAAVGAVRTAQVKADRFTG